MSDGNASYDVIVIGGGLAGLIAANRAAEFGKRVAVLEKTFVPFSMPWRAIREKNTFG
jgi:succinate dehydrogenase/fumarate reductase flavoprotein subunit